MTDKLVADQLVDVLETAGVERIYGVAGDSLNAITECLRRRKKIAWIPMRHEEAGAFAAGAEAHLTGRLAVCAGSCGPGNLHLINGLYDCHRSRVPVLAIAAQIPSNEIGGGYFQETHPEHLFQQCSHFCELISQPEQMPRILDIAIQTALTKRGVAVIAIPGDIAMKKAVSSSMDGMGFPHPAPSVRPSDQELDTLAQVLDKAGRITILGGAGCAGAHAELLALAGCLKAPIVHAMRGKEFIEYDNPFDVGMTGLLGWSAGYHAMEKCDLLLMLGTDFPYRQFYPAGATIVQIDSRGEQLGRRTKVDYGFVGDIRSTLRALLPRLKEKRSERHLKSALKEYRESRENALEMATGNHGTRMIHPQFLTRVIDELAAGDAIFTCDVGTPTVWAARYLHMNGRRRLLGSFTHASMANAMPQAIGAQAAYPGRQVVALCGDGGLSMLLGDILTLRQMNLPVKLIVYRNDSLAFVQQEQQVAGLLDTAVELANPDFARIAEASGLLGLTAERPEEVRPKLVEAFRHDGPALVEVHVPRQELAMPPTLTAKEAAGFSAFLAKAVLSARGDEVVDLAKTNLLRRLWT